MIAVYFDTSFYVNLRETDEPTGSSVLRGLDDLNVRLVLSRPLWQELILSMASDEDQQQLYSRIHRLRMPTLTLDEDLNWQLFLAPLKHRERFAQAQKQINDAVDKTRSLRLLAERGSKEEIEQFMASQQGTLQQMGWLSDDGSYNLGEMRMFLNELLGVDIAAIPPGELSKHTDLQLRERFGRAIVDHTNQQARLSSSILSASLRPGRHAADILSNNAQDRLSRDYRDSSHMAEFIAHSDVIDVLQLDAKQLRRVKADPTHPLQSQGLVNRCFSADRLLDVVPAIRALVS